MPGPGCGEPRCKAVEESGVQHPRRLFELVPGMLAPSDEAY